MIHKLTQRLTYVNHLLKTKSTGTPKELAEKLGLSERGWYKFRDQLVNDLQLPIKYCNYRKTYYYTEEGTFVIGFRKMNTEQSSKVSGGGLRFASSTYHSFSCTF
jgi:hypothetical protein